jgi:hypothetical protein
LIRSAGVLATAFRPFTSPPVLGALVVRLKAAGVSGCRGTEDGRAGPWGCLSMRFMVPLRPAAAAPEILMLSWSGVKIMILSVRRFLVAQDGVLYRLADATFTRMLRNPGSRAFPVLAGQRVRMASLIVELIGGIPVRVVRSTFATLSFNDDGCLDSGMFTRQQWALAESAVDPALVDTKRDGKVLDAASRFIAQGGRWRPSASLARTLNEAAPGRVDCRQLSRTRRVAEPGVNARICSGPIPDQGE